MNLKETIDNDIKQAMLAKQKDKLLALRSIKSMILLAETEKGAGGSLTSDAEMKLLVKAAKQRKESAEIYSRESRQDLADKENMEYDIISKYLPKALTDDELKDELSTIINSIGASSPADMGKVMGIASKKLAGLAEGKKIASVVKDLLLNN